MELDKARYIAIEGPIGIGKTSLVQLLGEYFNAHTVLETVEDNPFLKEFYKNRERYAFQTEMFFLLSRYRQQMSLSQYNLFNRVTITDYIFDRNRIFAYINLNNDEIRLYEDVYSILRHKIPKPDLLIYLQADIDTLKKRINMRGRAFEKNINNEYLDGVNKAFNNYFFHYTQSPILIVNANDINFVERKEDLKDLIKKILSHKKGREYYSPLGSI
ncbi:MAG TPA: deoxynucleoside kinase [Nitrospinae bacterium]|nr:deoxynucleoside kinase [Nitrospinota bacterium]HBA27122.1 deoxynucleoside kinase [Nitrospinota bacterium]